MSSDKIKNSSDESLKTKDALTDIAAPLFKILVTFLSMFFVLKLHFKTIFDNASIQRWFFQKNGRTLIRIFSIFGIKQCVFEDYFV